MWICCQKFEQQQTGRAFGKLWRNITSTNAKNLKAKRESLGTGTTRTSLRLNILIKLKSTQTGPREERTSAYVALRGKKRQRGVQSHSTKRHGQALHSVDRKPLEDSGKKAWERLILWLISCERGEEHTHWVYKQNHFTNPCYIKHSTSDMPQQIFNFFVSICLTIFNLIELLCSQSTAGLSSGGIRCTLRHDVEVRVTVERQECSLCEKKTATFKRMEHLTGCSWFHWSEMEIVESVRMWVRSSISSVWKQERV